MITEDEFQAHLDEYPDDSVARLVFADWLEECGDPRAEGYRILGTVRLYPKELKQSPLRWAFVASPRVSREWKHAELPSPIGYHSLSAHGPGHGFADQSRRALEDRAARALAELPAARRRQLMRRKPVTA